MKLGQLADLLRELDILTQRLIDQKDWLGRFERQEEGDGRQALEVR